MINNERNPPPTLLYKFYRINNDLKNTLRDNYIWLSNPNNFNDPFDCYKNLLTVKPTKENFEKLFSRDKNRKIRRHKIHYYNNHPKEFRKQYNSFIENFTKNYGVASFCEEYENILMWSHYADFHKGLCLCFNTKKDEPLFLMGRVQYTKEFMPIDLFHPDKTEVIDKLFLTKYQGWNYEKEYRMFEIVNENEIDCRKKYFNKEALQEVIFGCKISEEDKNDIIEIIKLKKYPKAIFKQAIMKEREFGLTFKEIKT